MDADTLANPTIERITIRLKAAIAKPYPNASLVLMLTVFRSGDALGLRIVEQFEAFGVSLQDAFELKRLLVGRSQISKHFIYRAMGCHAV
ncbi:MAG: hypothetical protein A3E00_15250 [Curvibacter sp. RIFCSPHIGHO2_12_FULL_63_18]|nr:MAG: hypothetical protein A2037_06335 [Curvibacter sp. GWA2_63_95]OGP02742.1 MAG: hypothetical protein A3E00_15250 [Curvibacter sp. RIFCSPHIGHO2_12_FULL_63_18]HCX81529.1 hypothetical protein [Rhodoferax sp.]